jgi:NAD(P)-dependent dehydrogenase (short-subunit alcohol dehydrogenase family)
MMAKALAQHGARRVYIIGRRLDKLQTAAKHSQSGNIIPLQGDVTSKESLDQMVNQIREEVGYIHFLVCNSGTAGPTIEKLSPTATLAEIRDFMWAWDPKSFNDTYALNDTATFFTIIAFLGLLDAGNQSSTRDGIQSSVLITSSNAAFQRKLATGVAYITSKAASLQMAKLLSTFLGPHGIRVNALAPGIFPSELAYLSNSGGVC